MVEHNFIKKTEKKKPINKKKIALKVIIFIFAAVLFGAIAAVVFCQMLKGFAAQNDEDQVSLDDYKEAIATELDDDSSSSADVEESVDEDGNVTRIVEVPEELDLRDYTKLYRQMAKVSRRAKKSIVTVTGISENTDWFNNSHENKNQVTGMIVAENSKDLFIVTESRGVSEAERIRLTFVDGESVDAEMQKADPVSGLCVLKVSLGDMNSDTLSKIKTAEFGSMSTTNQGDPVIFLGNSLGYDDTVTFGELTSNDNTLTLYDAEYTLLTTNIQGNKKSSGVLLDIEGSVVGIAVQPLVSSSRVVSFISITELTDLIENLSNNKSLLYTGIKGEAVTQEINEETGIPIGVYINEVESDSPAMLAGCKNGDVITKFNDKKIKSMKQYVTALNQCSVGDEVTLTLMREGVNGYSELTFDVTIGSL